MPSYLLKPSEAARYLGVDVGTLSVWRSTQRYNLTFLKIGGAVRYRLEDLDMFIQEGERKREK